MLPHDMSACAPLFAQAEEFCARHCLLRDFSGGAAVALSGGADSVFLLYYMRVLSQRENFPLEALHVNHGIRGKEAEEDELFCRELCARMAIPFHVFHEDVPREVKLHGGTEEEAARRVRYRVFDEYLAAHLKFVLLTAHTATDNLETVLFRMARGTGLRGLTGIPVRRGRILRPLLSLNGAALRSALDVGGISYVQDSTNEDVTYTRNYIRHQLLPAFLSVHPAAEEAVTGMCRRLARDEDYLTGEARRFFLENRQGNALPRAPLAHLHQAVFIRVVEQLYREMGGVSGCEDVHLCAAKTLACSSKSEGRVDFPDRLSFCVTREKAFFSNKICEKSPPSMYCRVTVGENKIDGCGVLFLTNEKNDCPALARLQAQYARCYHMQCPQERVQGALYLRTRRAGDAYRFGGMTRRVKTLFADQKLSRRQREAYPLLCDEAGILWIPGFGVRDGKDQEANDSQIYAYFFVDGGKDESGHFEGADG